MIIPQKQNPTQFDLIFFAVKTTFFGHASRVLYNRSNPVIVIYIEKKKKNKEIIYGTTTWI